MTRVLFVVPQAAHFITHRLQLALAARDAGYDVHVVLPKDETESSVIRAAGIPVHEMPLNRRSINAAAELYLIGSLVALYRRLRPQIVHHITVKPVLYGTVAARVARVPAVVNTVSGLGFLFIGVGLVGTFKRKAAIAAYRVALRHRNQRAIFLNEDDRDVFLEARILKRASTAMMSTGAGVNLDQFPPADEPTGIPIVVLPARMLWHKGVGEFVAAARQLRQNGTVARMVLVGGTDINRASVPEKQLREWEAEGIVEWWGLRDDMPSVLASSAIVCLPSYREGVPKALLEAAATGRAIVATDTPGCREVVRHGENGLLVKVGDYEALAAALEKLLRAPAERRRMANYSLVRARAEFDIAYVIRATLTIYAELAQSAVASRAGRINSEQRTNL